MKTDIKTTVAGIVVIIIGLIAGVFYNEWINATALITTGAGLIVAKDAK